VGGPVLFYGGFDPCGTLSFSDSIYSCAMETRAFNIFVVDDNLAYGVYNYRVITYDGTQWTQLGEPLDVLGETRLRKVWANKDIIVAIGEKGIYTRQSTDSSFTKQNGVPSGDYWHVWGFGSNDVWVGTKEGLLIHFDGDSWQTFETFDGAIGGMWGIGDTLFFDTGNGFYRLKGSKVSLIASWGSEYASDIFMTDMWGNTDSEVFIGVIDDRDPKAECGEAYIIEYDGKSLRQI
jgi:hypothetical protein